MIKKKVTIKNKVGLHARPAGEFVQVASRFDSDVKVVKDGEKVDGKSIMGLLMLAAERGSELLIIVDGPDENEAIEELLKLIDNNFNEE